jgi:hypothetical protein
VRQRPLSGVQFEVAKDSNGSIACARGRRDRTFGLRRHEAALALIANDRSPLQTGRSARPSVRHAYRFLLVETSPQRSPGLPHRDVVRPAPMQRLLALIRPVAPSGTAA